MTLMATEVMMILIIETNKTEETLKVERGSRPRRTLNGTHSDKTCFVRHKTLSLTDENDKRFPLLQKLFSLIIARALCWLGQHPVSNRRVFE